ncbi:Rieske 2Fe-2S domain-containing protein [Brevibacterium litoralis]|uniref:Rieske 2Fe-2S domain-containing protein n=1 Tax=Brevibacterium litoralis TaxID=3138935 RepID=UPI003D9AACDA
MKHIFEGNWLYLAHESQIPNPGDYLTTYIGRQPVVITRDKNGELHCLINACAHRGAMLCRRKTDNRMTLTCPFHGWTFRNDGKLLKVKGPDDAGYPEQSFNKEGSHDLTKVARFDSYRGFLFGTQVLVYGLVANYYPTRARGAGVAWCAGSGRLGGILAPVIVGLIISAGLGGSTAFFIFAGVAVLAAGVTSLVPKSPTHEFDEVEVVDAAPETV